MSNARRDCYWIVAYKSYIWQGRHSNSWPTVSVSENLTTQLLERSALTTVFHFNILLKQRFFKWLKQEEVVCVKHSPLNSNCYPSDRYPKNTPALQGIWQATLADEARGITTRLLAPPREIETHKEKRKEKQNHKKKFLK